MARCEHCGNDYDKTFEISFKDKTHVFDSFECAIHVIAPECNHCHGKIIGHGSKTAPEYFAVPIAPVRAAKADYAIVFKPAQILLAINARLQRRVFRK